MTFASAFENLLPGRRHGEGFRYQRKDGEKTHIEHKKNWSTDASISENATKGMSKEVLTDSSRDFMRGKLKASAKTMTSASDITALA